MVKYLEHATGIVDQRTAVNGPQLLVDGLSNLGNSEARFVRGPALDHHAACECLGTTDTDPHK